jgi:hypothetical protein
LNPAVQKTETEMVITVYKRLYTEKVGALGWIFILDGVDKLKLWVQFGDGR